MKRINYCRVFTQKLRENGVMGTFCEEVEDELLCLLFSKKDTWCEVTNMRSTYERVKEVAEELKSNGVDGVMNAFKETQMIWDTLELTI